jgi:hypothetical protein
VQVINAYRRPGEVAATDYLLVGRVADLIAADGTCHVWRGEGVWRSDSLNGITLHQLPQIPGRRFSPQFSTQEVQVA